MRLALTIGLSSLLAGCSPPDISLSSESLVTGDPDFGSFLFVSTCLTAFPNFGSAETKAAEFSMKQSSLGNLVSPDGAYSLATGNGDGCILAVPNSNVSVVVASMVNSLEEFVPSFRHVASLERPGWIYTSVDQGRVAINIFENQSGGISILALPL